MTRDRQQPEDMGRILEAAAADAPPSPGLFEIRAAFLEAAVADERASGIWGVLAAAAAVILLAVALAVGAPAVGSMLDGLVPERNAGPTLVSAEPNPREPSGDLDQETAAPSATAVATPSPAPAAAPGAVVVPVTPEPTLPASAAPSESAHPSGAPIVLPEPPIAIPTPPISRLP